MHLLIVLDNVLCADVKVNIRESFQVCLFNITASHDDNQTLQYKNIAKKKKEKKET